MDSGSAVADGVGFGLESARRRDRFGNARVDTTPPIRDQVDRVTTTNPDAWTVIVYESS